MLAALDSQFPLHVRFSCSIAVPLLRIPPLSSPQVAWEQPGYDSLTLMCWVHFFLQQKGAGPHHVDEKQMLMERFQDGKEF